MGCARFAGYEPLVGEIVGLRTFRVDESGLLLPLYSNDAWYDGENTAACAPPTGDRRRHTHPAAAPDCECGFYAYGSAAAAAQNRNMRFVQAVVSCWGRVVAGTQGVRAEHARIDALWFGPTMPAQLRRRVAATYPSVPIYADRPSMLAEHPPSTLPCYALRPAHADVLSRLGCGVAGTAVLALGVLPSSVRTGLVWDLWFATTLAAAALMLWLLVGTRGTGHLAAAAVTAELLAWLAAPAFGIAGWLLRLPVLRGVLVGAGVYLRTLCPGYFPVVRTEQPKAFCGVRP